MTIAILSAIVVVLVAPEIIDRIGMARRSRSVPPARLETPSSSGPALLTMQEQAAFDAQWARVNEVNNQLRRQDAARNHWGPADITSGARYASVDEFIANEHRGSRR